MNKTFESILSNAKSIYKESIKIDNVIIEELALSIITDIKILQSEKKPSIQRERVRLDNEHSKDVDTLAYIFSEYEHTALFPDNTQTAAFKKVSDLLNVKHNTFTNKRDYFDSHTNSQRIGWEKELSISLKKVFDELKILSKKEVLDIGYKIIKKYQEKKENL